MSEKVNKTVTLRFRCSPDEKELFLKKSEMYKSFSHYVRKNLLEKERGEVVPPVEMIRMIDNLVFELNRVGNNINQIAKYINQRKEINDAIMQEYKSLLNNLVEIEKEISLSIKSIINKK